MKILQTLNDERKDGIGSQGQKYISEPQHHFMSKLN